MFGRLVAWVRGDADRLRAFHEVRKARQADNRVHLGRRVVEVSRIDGSVGRWRDFDKSFMPVRPSAGARWKRVALAFHKGVELPPVILSKIGDSYFVEDGNHRVSVARYQGVEMIDADVTEFRPLLVASEASRVAESVCDIGCGQEGRLVPGCSLGVICG